MRMPVRFQKVDGQYRAVLLAASDITGVGATTADALIALRRELAERADWGDIVWVNIPVPGEPDDLRELSPEELDDMRSWVAEIYRERDAQKAAEFPE